jgi:hypothetical protein
MEAAGNQHASCTDDTPISIYYAAFSLPCRLYNLTVGSGVEVDGEIEWTVGHSRNHAAGVSVGGTTGIRESNNAELVYCFEVARSQELKSGGGAVTSLPS